MTDTTITLTPVLKCELEHIVRKAHTAIYGDAAPPSVVRRARIDNSESAQILMLLNPAKYPNPPIEVGSRVSRRFGATKQLATVQYIKNDRAAIVLDEGDYLTVYPVSRLELA